MGTVFISKAVTCRYVKLRLRLLLWLSKSFSIEKSDSDNIAQDRIGLQSESSAAYVAYCLLVVKYDPFFIIYVLWNLGTESQAL